MTLMDIEILKDETTEKPPPTRPPIDNAATLLADQSIVLPPEIIKGVLHQSLKGVVGSSSKARKTWILLDVATSVAAIATIENLRIYYPLQNYVSPFQRL